MTLAAYSPPKTVWVFVQTQWPSTILSPWKCNQEGAPRFSLLHVLFLFFCKCVCVRHLTPFYLKRISSASLPFLSMTMKYGDTNLGVPRRQPTAVRLFHFSAIQQPARWHSLHLVQPTALISLFLLVISFNLSTPPSLFFPFPSPTLQEVGSV